MNTFDNTIAMNEGWAISGYGRFPQAFRLERMDEAAIFPSDEDAWRHVVRRAKAGSAYHRAAIDFLRDHSPMEYTYFVDRTSFRGRLDFTIGFFVGLAEIAGCLRIRRWLGKLPARTGRRADGYDWIIDRRCIATGPMTRSEDDE